MLPDVINFVFDTLALHADCADYKHLEWMILDISDAFWTLVLRPE